MQIHKKKLTIYWDIDNYIPAMILVLPSGFFTLIGIETSDWTGAGISYFFLLNYLIGVFIYSCSIDEITETISDDI